MWGSYVTGAAHGQAVEGMLWMNGDGTYYCRRGELLLEKARRCADSANRWIIRDRNPDAFEGECVGWVGLGGIKLGWMRLELQG
jgi:hypothetical protein